jgi:uncharacterized membrane-anchored protein
MHSLPKINNVYWLSLIAASIFGTNTGDYLSDTLHLGHAPWRPTSAMPSGAAIVYGLALAATFYCGSGGKLIQPIAYWATIALIRSFGTTVGDTVANNVFGLPPATAITGAVFIGMIAYFYGIRRDNEASTGPKAQHA